MRSIHSSSYWPNIQPGSGGRVPRLRDPPLQSHLSAVCGTQCGGNCYHARMLSHDAILKRLRKICLRLSAAAEGITFGHPTFRVEKKMFAVLEEYKGELGICLKVGTLLQGVFLDDPRFFRTPYIGKHG